MVAKPDHTVKLVRYSDRIKFPIIIKNNYKGKKSLTERLTKERMKKLQEATDLYGFSKMWTNDRKLIVKDDNQMTKPLVFYE